VTTMTNGAFSVLMEKYGKLVYTVCRQLVRDDSAAEDLTQDTFLAAYTHRESCPPGYEKQWLARIAANRSKDYLSSAWSRRTVFPGDDLLSFAGGGAPPEDELISRSGETEIKDAINGLREPYRQICIMRFIDEKSPDEIAAELDRPPKTVYTQLSRAKQMLRYKIERSGENGNI
jgi:RNA polymerase sigma factor (sigma-70 family)